MKSIETHARAFLPLNISAISSVVGIGPISKNLAVKEHLVGACVG